MLRFVWAERVEDVIAAAFDGGVARAAQPDAAAA
jgi:hypothetical protein